ncbi:DUF4193 domain-containing protein [Mycobacterium sp. 21AC1]|uniref:DUF4193 domain-containing protein n=1 Tax=[Mycobacterium] appelbergii TaxID=2939269 RepID=UPI002939216B|nr:DUF4193 domain-containing protein [Mycobacterium sp. 21AC1]MDV3124141.1 DUF4193 domain-containing protein [Mycobacterium sp. 21AC1]
MATDYDAPRVKDQDESTDEPIEQLASRRTAVDTAVIDVDEPVDSFDLPDIDLSGEELSVRVVPKQADEFTCSSCFLVHHHSRMARQRGNEQICVDCA